MMEQQDKIILIGAGNVAHHLAAALLKAGENLCQIYSRTLDAARQLGMKTGRNQRNLPGWRCLYILCK